MKIVSVKIQNFKPFKNLSLPEDGELPDGLILIKGPNSTGKSSLFEAILWALWGPSSVKPTNDELVSFSSSFCKVILIFEVMGHRYKIERSYDSASGMKVILYMKSKSAWRRIADKTRSVERAMESILNIDSNQALHTLLVRQGEVALIANATASVLRDMLVDVYNLALLEDMENQLKHLETDLNNRYNALEEDYTNPDYIKEQIRKTEKRINDYQTKLGRKDAEVKKLESALSEFPDPSLLENLSTLQNEVDRLHSVLERTVEMRDRELSKDDGLLVAEEKLILARITSLKKQSKRLDETIEGLKEKISAIDFEVGNLIGESRRLQKAMDTLKASVDDAKCPTCSKPITNEERTKLIKEYTQKITSSVETAESLKNDRHKLIEASREATDKKSEIEKLVNTAERVLGLQQELEKIENQIQTAKEEMKSALAKSGLDEISSLLQKHGSKSINELHLKITRLMGDLKGLRTEYASIEQTIATEEKQMKQLDADVVAMKRIGAELDNLKSLVEHTQYVRRKLVSGFLADYVIQKRLIGIVRGATNPYVRAFTNDQYSGIDLIPTKATGRGGAGLLLKIRDMRDNADKKSSQLSYGDRTAVSLALRLGISRTMSAMRPLKESPAISPRVKCVLLDEPLGGLDKQRRTAVVQNLLNDQSFKQIFLITHTDVQSWQGVPVVDVSKTGISSVAVLMRDSDE